MMQKQATTADVSLCSRADQLSRASVPLQVFSGWLDATAAAAINLYSYCGKAAGEGTAVCMHHHVQAGARITLYVLRSL